jgi:hypothetical protein
MVSGWGSSHSHLHLPRRPHDQNDGDSKLSRSSSPEELPRHSASSDATPRQTPATTRFLANDHDSNRIQDNRTLEHKSQESKSQDISSSKRLGFFADKISSSFAGSGHSAINLKTSLHPSQLLHPLSHTRNDSTAASASTSSLTTMASPSNMPNVVKSHSSPSKVPAG